MPAADFDVIDRLVGIEPGSPLDAVRARRPQAREQAQASYAALFAPATPGGVPVEARFALAAFVAGLHGAGGTTEFYSDGLAAAGASPTLCAAVQAAVKQSATTGPFGRYPAGPLSAEDTGGTEYAVDEATAAALGPRLAAAFAHAHRLVFHPRDAEAAWLQSLLDAGWSTTDIVTLSQIVSFLSFQIRAVAGLRVLAGR